MNHPHSQPADVAQKFGTRGRNPSNSSLWKESGDKMFGAVFHLAANSVKLLVGFDAGRAVSGARGRHDERGAAGPSPTVRSSERLRLRLGNRVPSFCSFSRTESIRCIFGDKPAT
jgi:hypothetical protein